MNGVHPSIHNPYVHIHYFTIITFTTITFATLCLKAIPLKRDRTYRTWSSLHFQVCPLRFHTC
jgi:hypothetical protein